MPYTTSSKINAMENSTISTLQTQFDQLTDTLPQLKDSKHPIGQLWANVHQALENLSYYSKLQDLVSEIIISISEIGDTVSGVDNLTQTLATLIQTHFNFYYAGIFLMDEARQRVELSAAAGQTRESIPSQQITCKIDSTTTISQAIQTQHAVVTTYKKGEASIAYVPNLPRSCTEIVLPLVNRGEILGALTLFNTEPVTPGSPQDWIKILQPLASQIAMAIENTNLSNRVENNNHFLKTIIEHIPDPIFIKDREHTWIEMNQANADLIGQPYDKLIGKTDRDFFPQELSNEFYRRDDEVFATHQSRTFEDKKIWADGREHIAYTRLIPIPSKAGQPEYILGISQDISERTAQETEKEKLLSEMAMVYNGSQAIANALSERQLFDALFQQFLTQDPDEIFAYYFKVIDDEPIWAELEAYWQPTGPGQTNFSYAVGDRVYLPESPQARLFIRNEPLFVEDVANDKRLSVVERKGLSTHKIRSLAILPMATIGQAIGVTFIYFTEPHTFNTMIKRFWRAMVDQASVLLANRRLIQEVTSRAIQIETAAEVARIASSILDVQQLLNSTVNLIRDRFDLYYVGVFLVDEAKEWAVLRAGTGEAGRIQLEKRHRLKIGGESMIGWCLANQKGRVALDVGKDAVHFQNPDLPDTRSELALPLIHRGQSMGALTVQSIEQAAFSQQDIIFLQTMADQLVNAIENARLFGHAQQEINERKRVQQEILHRNVELQKAESAIREAEAKYRSIVQNSVEGIFQTTPEGRYISVNPALAHIYKFESPESLIAELTDIEQELYVDPNRRTEFMRLMDQNDAVSEFESQIYRKDGSIIWISENARAVRDRGGRLLYYEGTVTNITERKQAEAALAAERNLLRTLIDNLPDNIYVKDLEGRFIINNIEHVRVLGAKTPDEVIGKTDFDFFPKEVAEQYYADEQAIIKSGRPLLHKEEPVLDQTTGNQIWVSVTKVPLREKEGKIMGIVGISRDITESKRSKENLQAALERTQALYRISDVLAKIADQQTIFEAVLREYLSLLNLKRGGILLVDEASGYNKLQALYVDGYPAEPNLVTPVDQDLINRHLDKNPVPLIIEDVHAHPLTEGYKDFFGQVRSMLLLPLIIHDKIIGRIGADSLEVGHPFSQDDIEIGQAIADQLTIWLEKRQLLEETQKRSSLLQTAAEVSRTASSILDVDELINKSVNLIRDKFDFYYVGLFLVDPDREWAVLRAGTGEAGQIQLAKNHRLKIGGESMIGWCVQHCQARIALDVGEEAVHFQNPDLPDTHSEMALPLISRDEILGALTVQSVERNAFSDEDITLLQTMADQLANSIKNAYLFEEVTQTQKEAEDRLQETIALQQLSQALSATLRVEEVLDIFFRACTKVIGFEYVLLSQVDKNQHCVKAIGGAGVTDNHFKQANHSLDSSDITVDIVKSGETEVLAGWDDRLDQEIYEQEGQVDWVRVFIPVTLRQENIGLVETGFKNRQATVTEFQIRLLRAFIDQTVLALDNAQRYEASQRVAQREALIKEITTKVRASTDIDTILQVTVREVSEAIHNRRAYVNLIPPKNGESQNDK